MSPKLPRSKDHEKFLAIKNATSHIIQGISMTVERGSPGMGTLRPLRKLENFFDVISKG